MNQSDSIELVRRTGVVAIMRAKSADQLLQAAEAVYAGGIRVIEVTLTTPGALGVIEEAVSRFGQDVLFGAGTVLDAESARAAILAGAGFIVSPGFDAATVALCRRYSIPVIPGAFTPTEIISAWQAGAAMVKIFPASLGGPGLIKALKAPLPQIEMLPTGGVDADNAAEFIRAGAVAVAAGSSLIDSRLLATRDFAALTARARRFIEEVARGREG